MKSTAIDIEESRIKYHNSFLHITITNPSKGCHESRLLDDIQSCVHIDSDL